MKFEGIRGFLSGFAREKSSHTDRFRVQVLSPAPGLFRSDEAPAEIRFILARKPEWQRGLEHLFERGYGIGVRTVRRAPEHVLTAVRTISEASARGTLEPWLSRLIRRREIPVFGEAELHAHYEEGMNLFDEAEVIVAARHTMKRLILVDLEERGIEDRDWSFVEDMNRVLEPLSEEYLIRSIHRDLHAVPSGVLRPALGIAFIEGPIAHLLERWASGMGILFAAVADDVMRTARDIHALRDSGFTWRLLWKQSRITVPLLTIAVWLSLSAGARLDRGELAAAGFMFGLASVLIPLSGFLERLLSLRNDFIELSRDRKLAKEEDTSPTRHVWHELRIHPKDVGMGVGILSAPIAVAVLFSLLPTLARNGWFLAAVASIEYAVSWAVVRCMQGWFERGYAHASDRLASAAPDTV